MLKEYLGEASQSHIMLERGEEGGGARPGLLGADFRREGEYYRITKICRGDDKDPKKSGPLAAPDLKVSEGDYLIAVEGEAIRADLDVSAALEGRAGEEVKLTVNDKPSREGSWEIAVKTIANEAGVRYADWVRGNRARVSEASEGKVGYLHVMNADDVDGGMIGSGAPHKIAGGWVLFVPEFGFYMHDAGAWSPENFGVEPDYVVSLRPYELSGGHDPQLEKAIELAMGAIKTYRTRIPDLPPYRPAP